MKTPVSFELAKLLKEKGFNLETEDYFLEDGIEYSYPKKENWNLKPDTISAPTIAEVIMWLYEKQEIWIGVDKNKEDKFKILICPKGKQSYIKGITDGKFEFSKIQWYNSPTEAYEAAIEYVLTKLI